MPHKSCELESLRLNVLVLTSYVEFGAAFKGRGFMAHSSLGLWCQVCRNCLGLGWAARGFRLKPDPSLTSCKLDPAKTLLV